MMEHERAHAGFWVHHEAFGQLHANLLRLQQLPDAGLILQGGAGGVAEAVAAASIFRSEAVDHRHVGGVGETPVFADTPV